MLRKQTQLLIFILCSPLLHSTLLGQGDVVFKAWLEYERFEELTLVRGWFGNNTTKAQRLRYVFTTVQGEEKEVKKNNFYAASFKPQQLAKAVAFFGPGNFDLIKLEVFNNNDLIAVDSITAGMLEPKEESTADSKKNLKEEAFSTNIELEIDGLIIDETRSKIAHDFYEFFYNKWVPPKNAKGFFIVVRELPARGLASRISIEVNQQKLFERFLQPRNDLLEELSGQVVAALQKHLEKEENLKSQIENEDQMGSGIF